jgi:hypothetical protein
MVSILRIAVVGVAMLLASMSGKHASSAEHYDSVLPAENERGTRYAVEYPSIGYGTVRPSERIAKLQSELDQGVRTIDFDDTDGYLAAVLEALDIDPASQLLVFSKTSINKTHILPSRPRAIFFNDDAYVAIVPGSGMLEIATMDPQLGPVFFILEQRASTTPQFDRQTVQCLRCHDSLTMTGGGVPRFILGSGYVDTRSNLVSHEGWMLTTPKTPFRFRWGGWYVTGNHGDLAHLGNIVVNNAAELQDLESLRIFNRETLDGLIDTELYPTGHSDIVALLVIEHQVHVQNLITRVNYDVRTGIAEEEQRNKDDNNSNDWFVSEEMKSLIEESGEPLVKALLFVDEAELTAPVTGSTNFADQFERRGPYDSKGRSLRQFDLRTRTFRYPLSYLVYSEAFDALPRIARDYIYRRLAEILGDGRGDAVMVRLQPAERAVILEILRTTKPDFAAFEEAGFVHLDEQ